MRIGGKSAQFPCANSAATSMDLREKLLFLSICPQRSLRPASQITSEPGTIVGICKNLHRKIQEQARLAGMNLRLGTVA